MGHALSLLLLQFFSRINGLGLMVFAIASANSIRHMLAHTISPIVSANGDNSTAMFPVILRGKTGHSQRVRSSRASSHFEEKQNE
jgi:hypothetical protein